MYCTLLYIRMLCTEKRNVERRGTEKQIRTEQSHSHFWWARLCNLSLERARLGKTKIHTEKEKQELWSNYMCKCVSASLLLLCVCNCTTQTTTTQLYNFLCIFFLFCSLCARFSFLFRNSSVWIGLEIRELVFVCAREQAGKRVSVRKWKIVSSPKNVYACVDEILFFSLLLLLLLS